jgi:hypothetical protein
VFIIPQNKPHWPTVRSKEALVIDALPLVGEAPARKPVVLHFVRDQECDLHWNIWDAQHEPARDCIVRATLFFGRSAFGLGGTPVKGFRNRYLEHCGDGLYTCRIRLGAQVAIGNNYVTVIDATRGERGGKPLPFGHWEEISEIL